MATDYLSAPELANSATGALESFLTEFKTSPEQSLATAMGEITIDEDDLSDEYDFMDEDEGAAAQRQQEKERRRKPQHKYKDMLQQLANREVDEMMIDLDDLASVIRHQSPLL